MCVNELTEGPQQHVDVCHLRLFSIIMVMLLPLVFFSPPSVATNDSSGIDDDDAPVARSEPSEPSKKTIDPKKKLEKEAGAIAEEITVLNTKIKPGVRRALSVNAPVWMLNRRLLLSMEESRDRQFVSPPRFMVMS